MEEYDSKEEEIRKIQEIKNEEKIFAKNLDKLLAGDKKVARQMLKLGVTPNVLVVCGLNPNLDVVIKKR